MLSKNQLKLVQGLHLKKQRDLRREFLAEGVKTVDEILAQDPSRIKVLYALSDAISERSTILKQHGVPFTEIDETDLSKMSLQQQPNRMLAVCRYFEEGKRAPGQDRFNFFLDDVRDPGNFGTIIRICAWFGIGTLYCSPESCDLYNPKVIQSTMGAFLRVKVIYTEFESLLSSHPAKNIYGAVLAGENIFTTRLEPGLIVIGNEANGISPGTMKLLNRRITIPGPPQATTESLNAAVAASIIAAEFYRQLEVMNASIG